MTASSETPVIPDHELLHLIGRGSYGEVWLARNALGTPRAVKIVRRSSFESDRPYVREFSGIQKFEPISRSHDGLVDILQVGRHEGAGLFYYVMELADHVDETQAPGERGPGYQPRTLASELKRYGRIPVSQALPVFINLANALGHLHGHGLLHRDVKPANVIFVRGIAKLADIGLVAEAGESRTFVGTEGFIPPEGPGTVGADIYALGKLMYEAVTGRDRNDFPALPLDRSTPDNNAALLELNAILLKCCDPDPQKRYRSAAAVQADLALLQSGQSVTRLHSFEKKLRLARQIGVVAAVLAALAVLSAFVLRRQEQLAQENFRRSERLRIRAEKAEDEANDRLHAALLARAGAERRTGASGARRRALESLRQAAALKPVSPELRSEAISTLALADFPIARRWTSDVPTLQPLSLTYDAQRLARARAGGVVEISKVEDDSVLFSLSGNTPEANWVGPFSADGRWIVVTATDGHVRLWDTLEGTVRMEWTPTSGLERLYYFGKDQLLLKFPDGAEIADIESGERRRWNIKAARGFWPCSDGRRVVVTRADNKPELWDAESMTKLRDWHFPTNCYAYCCSWNPDGSLVAIGTSDRRVLVLSPDAPGDEPVHVFRGHGAEVESVAWSSDGRIIVSCGWDTTTRFWGLMEGRELTRETVQSWHYGFTPDDSRFFCFVPTRHELVLSDVQYQQVCRIVPEPGEDIVKSPARAAFVAGSSWMVTATHDGVRSYRVADGRPGPLLPEAGGLRDFLMFPEPSRHFVAMANRGRLLGEWRTNAAGQLEFGSLRPVKREELPIIHPRHAPWLGIPTRDLRWYAYDGYQGDLPESAGVLDWEISPDGRFAGAMLAGGHGSYWTLERSSKRTDVGPTRNSGVGFTSDSRFAFFAANNELFCVDTASGKEKWRTHLTPIQYGASAVQVSPDDKLVAAVMTPFTVSLVDIATGQSIATLEHPSAQLINNITFSPDGRWFAVACSTHQTQLWDLHRLRAELAALNLNW